MSALGSIVRRKPAAYPAGPPATLTERAAEASLNGSIALDVFESAAARLEAAATELDDVAVEAEEEADRVMVEAQQRVIELRALSQQLDGEAGGHRLRAVRIRDLISVPTAVVS